MTRHLVILGAGNFAREAYWHVKGTDPSVRLVFVDDFSPAQSLQLGGERIPIIKDWRFEAVCLDGEAAKPVRFEEFVIGVGDPRAKRTLVAKALASGLRPAATVVHPRALIQGTDCEVGLGGIVTPGCVITTNVKIGHYVLLNLNTTVGHDVVIGDYATCNPGCQISGNVILGEGVSLGTGAAIREKVAIAPGVTVGAQGCVVKNIEEPGITVVGVPARRLG